METEKCSICNGKKFIRVREEDGYTFFKRCSCLTGKPVKIEQENPFKEKENNNYGNKEDNK